MRRYLIFILLHLVSFSISAQSVMAVLDTNSIELGEQTTLTISLTYRVDGGEDVKTSFPEIGDTLADKIEVLKKSKIDTISPDANDLFLFSQVQQITISSYDIGVYSIPAFEFSYNKEKLNTPVIPFEVRDVVNPIQKIEEIADIKPPILDPLTFWEKYQDFILIGVIGGLAICLIVLGIRFYLKNRKNKIPEVEPKVVVPADIAALEQLKELKAQELWQNSEVKEYYARLSEILRSYLEARFETNVLDKTTDEIIASLKFVGIPQDQFPVLYQLLSSSDYVKFAKENPISQENTSAMVNAEIFIQKTKEIDA